ncbi:hypothetical protein EDD86DRAFT_247146 [Gorgonomyces haynaldii]|nr:hypothetical protein EDD86DRAFT_247146 [Gorgonomyces haynaldii]
MQTQSSSKERQSLQQIDQVSSTLPRTSVSEQTLLQALNKSHQKQDDIVKRLFGDNPPDLRQQSFYSSEFQHDPMSDSDVTHQLYRNETTSELLLDSLREYIQSELLKDHPPEYSLEYALYLVYNPNKSDLRLLLQYISDFWRREIHIYKYPSTVLEQIKPKSKKTTVNAPLCLTRVKHFTFGSLIPLKRVTLEEPETVEADDVRDSITNTFLRGQQQMQPWTQELEDRHQQLLDGPASFDDDYQDQQSRIQELEQEEHEQTNLERKIKKQHYSPQPIRRHKFEAGNDSSMDDQEFEDLQKAIELSILDQYPQVDHELQQALKLSLEQPYEGKGKKRAE